MTRHMTQEHNMPANDTNGRIKTADRLARIETKLDGIAEKLERLPKYEERLAGVESDVKLLKERWGWLAGAITLVNALAAFFLNKIFVKP